jgi:hypothetical protein
MKNDGNNLPPTVIGSRPTLGMGDVLWSVTPTVTVL